MAKLNICPNCDRRLANRHSLSRHKKTCKVGGVMHRISTSAFRPSTSAVQSLTPATPSSRMKLYTEIDEPGDEKRDNRIDLPFTLGINGDDEDNKHGKNESEPAQNSDDEDEAEKRIITSTI